MSIKHLPHYYQTQLTTLNGDFSISLDEMTKSYPYAKAYPDSSTMSDKFNSDQAAMNTVRGNLFLFKDSLLQDIETIALTSARINKQVNKLNKDNGILKTSMQGLENASEGAIGMYDDTRTLYNKGLLENWLYFIVICGITSGIIKTIN